MDNYHHFYALIDCQCGYLMFILDRQRSETPVTFNHLWKLRRAAKKMGRHFVDSIKTNACPQCKMVIDLTRADGHLKDNGSELVEVKVGS